MSPAKVARKPSPPRAAGNSSGPSSPRTGPHGSASPRDGQGPRDRNALWAGLLVDELAKAGVQHVVLAPGSRSAPLALAAAAQGGLCLHVVIDERSAAFAALGMAKAGALAAVVTTSGTAAANLLPAAVEADQSATPLLLVTADRPTELVDVGANQAIQQRGLFGPVVRWACDLGLPELDVGALRHARQAASRAAAIAAGLGPGPAGPVHLNVPLREDPPASDLDAIAALTQRARNEPAVALALHGRDGPMLEVAAASPAVSVDWDGLLVGDRGLVVACEGTLGGLGGLGGVEPEVPGVAAALAAHLGVPLVCDAQALEPGALVHADAVLASPAFRAAARPDWILHLGAGPTSKAVRAYLAEHAGAVRIKVDDRGRLWDEHASATHAVPIAPQAAAAILAVRRRRGDAAWLRLWQRAADAACAVTRAQDPKHDWETTIPNTLLAAAGRGFVWAGSSLPIRDVDRYAHAFPARVVASRGASGIDGVLSAAAGAGHVLAHRTDAGAGARAFCYVGDLSFQHDVGGLAAVASLAPELTIVVVNNQGGAIFEHLPVAQRVPRPTFEQLFATPQAFDIAHACAAFGLPHRRITGTRELAKAIESPGVVEVVLDRATATKRRKAHLEAVVAAVDHVVQAANTQSQP